MTHITRREMLGRLGALMGLAAGSAAVSPLSMAARARAQAAAGDSFIALNPVEAETVRAVVARLIPADENGPGALEARADRYIDRALAGVLKGLRLTYTTGLADLNARSRTIKGDVFARLKPEDQDEILTNLQQTSVLFFNLIRNHTIQGMFGDPFYGGNANFIGWNLIGYPGARTAVSADMQRLDRKPEPSRKSAYDYGMFSKGEV